MTDMWTVRLVNLAPVALFGSSKLASSGGKHIEEIIHAHIVCSMYKSIKSAKDSEDLSIGFDRSRERRQRELTKNKNIKGKNHVTIMLRVIFDFAELQGKSQYILGYRLTLTRNSDSDVLKKCNAIHNAKIKIESSDWYTPNYTPSLSQQTILSNQILKKLPKELQNIETSVFMKEVKTQKL